MVDWIDLSRLNKQQEALRARGLCIYNSEGINEEVKCQHEYRCLIVSDKRDEALDRYARKQAGKHNPFARKKPIALDAVCKEQLPPQVRKELGIE